MIKQDATPDGSLNLNQNVNATRAGSRQSGEISNDNERENTATATEHFSRGDNK